MSRLPDLQAQLFADATAGDSRAAEVLLETYLPRLRAFVRARLRPDLRARESDSDIVQSVCREFLRHREGLRYDGETQFRGWLFTVTANKVREKLRFHQQPRRAIAREEIGSTMDAFEGTRSPSPSEAAMTVERAAILEDALDALSDADREIITLARLAELPMADVAARLGKREDSTRRQLGRALLRLGDELERRHPNEVREPRAPRP